MSNIHKYSMLPMYLVVCLALQHTMLPSNSTWREAFFKITLLPTPDIMYKAILTSRSTDAACLFNLLAIDFLVQPPRTARHSSALPCLVSSHPHQAALLASAQGSAIIAPSICRQTPAALAACCFLVELVLCTFGLALGANA